MIDCVVDSSIGSAATAGDGSADEDNIAVLTLVVSLSVLCCCCCCLALVACVWWFRTPAQTALAKQDSVVCADEDAPEAQDAHAGGVEPYATRARFTE